MHLGHIKKSIETDLSHRVTVSSARRAQSGNSHPSNWPRKLFLIGWTCNVIILIISQNYKKNEFTSLFELSHMYYYNSILVLEYLLLSIILGSCALLGKACANFQRFLF
jgi:hypothetical protein